MGSPDHNAAIRYAIGRIKKEVRPDHFFHGVHHTERDVLPFAMELAARIPLPSEETLLVTTAAAYHDIGFAVQYENNEPIAAQIVREVLPDFGYSTGQAARIGELILATGIVMVNGKFVQVPGDDLLAQALCDADLNAQGRGDFFETGHRLRREWDIYRPLPDGPRKLADWYVEQLKFQQGHKFFTEAARKLRQAGKEENIRQLEALVDRIGRI